MADTRKYALELKDNIVRYKAKDDQEAKGIPVTPDTNTLLGYLAYCFSLAKTVEQEMQASTDGDIRKLAPNVAHGVLLYLMKISKSKSYPNSLLEIELFEGSAIDDTLILDEDFLGRPPEHIFSWALRPISPTYSQWFLHDYNDSEQGEKKSQLEAEIRSTFNKAKDTLKKWIEEQNAKKKSELNQAIAEAEAKQLGFIQKIKRFAPFIQIQILQYKNSEEIFRLLEQNKINYKYFSERGIRNLFSDEGLEKLRQNRIPWSWFTPAGIQNIAIDRDLLKTWHFEFPHVRENLQKHPDFIGALIDKLITRQDLEYPFKNPNIHRILENEFAVAGLKAGKFTLADIDNIPEEKWKKIFCQDGLQKLENQAVGEVAEHYTAQTIPTILLKKQLISQNEFDRLSSISFLFEDKGIISFLEEFRHKISLDDLLRADFKKLLSSAGRKALNELLNLSKEKKIDRRLLLEEAASLDDPEQVKRLVSRNFVSDRKMVAQDQLRWNMFGDYEKRKYLLEGLNEGLFTFEDINKDGRDKLCSQEGLMRLRALQDMKGDEYKAEDAIKMITRPKKSL